MAALRNIPWPRVLAESAIIVSSILLALWVDAWWSERQERVEELEILSALHEELQGLVQLIGENRTYTGAIKDATLEIANASIDPDPDLNDAEIDRLLADLLWYIERSFTNAPLLESLVASTDIDVVSNSRLRRQLGVFMFKLTAFRLEVNRESDYFNRRMMPFVQEHANMARIYVLDFQYPGSSDRVYPPYNLNQPTSGESNREVLQSREFQNILLHRLTTLTNLLEWHAEIRPDLEQLANLLEVELDILMNQ